jgi:hypothetical protein
MLLDASGHLRQILPIWHGALDSKSYPTNSRVMRGKGCLSIILIQMLGRVQRKSGVTSSFFLIDFATRIEYISIIISYLLLG